MANSFSKTKQPKQKSPLPLLSVLVLFGLVFLLFGLGFYFNWFGKKPTITLEGATNASPQTPIAVGAEISLIAVVSNPKADVCKIEAFAIQGDKKIQLVDYIKDKKANPFKSEISRAKLSEKNLKKEGFNQAEALLEIKAQDCSLFKRESQLTQKIVLDLKPPKVSLISTQHYINQGGADVAVYEVSDDAVWSGVQIGDYIFKGYPKPNAESKNEHFAFFVFSYELPEKTPIKIIAKDAVGNTAQTSLFPSRFFPQEFRKRDIEIPEDFIINKIGAIIENTSELKDANDNLTNFINVNRHLRKKNTEFLYEISKKSEEIFFWKDAFEPLRNADLAGKFADYRDYFYNKEKVDHQVHLGFDMAVTKHYPVNSGGAGKVLFADYFGIYGNTVMVDHGYGLVSLYAHLSSIDVQDGDLVQRGDIVGKTGETGLAGGDHLHFSLLIQGVQTNPIEFWDQHWIQDHVYLRIDPANFGKN